ncbi:MAG: type II secretion system GspH family protein [Clostridium sp.]|nr:type II secretion system GspH family protein [Clostridium sp.]MCM1400224.1 type II secretion system GspH family protein [Clostridium sp.]MCM1460323.1 type II secretion system GspH family protein [Bacteroides sp.]
MKKTNNKGFSLVELIIVIAIMAILAGAIAPALIRYIDKSRKSNDLSAAKTIKTAVETAMSNEDTYASLTSTTNKPVLKLTPGSTSAAGVAVTNVTWVSNATTTQAEAVDEIFKNLSESVPKIKYKKAADSTIGAPTTWYVACTGTGQVKVILGTNTEPTINASTGAVTGGYELVPEINKNYQ